MECKHLLIVAKFSFSVIRQIDTFFDIHNNFTILRKCEYAGKKICNIIISYQEYRILITKKQMHVPNASLTVEMVILAIYQMIGSRHLSA